MGSVHTLSFYRSIGHSSDRNNSNAVARDAMNTKKAAIVLNMPESLNRFFCGLQWSAQFRAFLIILSFSFNPFAQAADQALLEKELTDKGLVWLEAEGQKFIGLWEEERSGSAVGALLILHAAGQTPDWPDTIHPLRSSVIQHGWATLSIELPLANSELDTPQHINARVQSALTFLEGKGQLNLAFVAFGESAEAAYTWVANAIENNPPADDATGPIVAGSFRALIIVSARAIVLKPTMTLPTLDVYFDEHYLDIKEVKERRTLARKYRLPFYHQVKLLSPYMTETGEENALVRRIRGFLNKYAKGVEVGK